MSLKMLIAVSVIFQPINKRFRRSDHGRRGQNHGTTDDRSPAVGTCSDGTRSGQLRGTVSRKTMATMRVVEDDTSYCMLQRRNLLSWLGSNPELREVWTRRTRIRPPRHSPTWIVSSNLPHLLSEEAVLLLEGLVPARLLL